jgi:prolyl 4-hydroxylase
MKLQQHTKDIWTIDNFWSASQCQTFIDKSESIGYEVATIDTEKGKKVVDTVRNNQRILHSDIQLAEAIWNQLKDFVPAKLGNSVAVGLNELFRFYRYEPGQQFKKHRDQSFIRNDAEASYYTFMIYLNDGYEGGDTTFDLINIHPKKGTALLFLHSLEHSGSEVTQGIKYVLRTDIMYKLKDEELSD